MSKKPFISVISPVYGAEKIVDELVKQVITALESIDCDYEFILIEDGSPDNAWKKIEENCAIHSKVRGIKLSRNFGQHFAITAGIEQAKGDYVVVMDCDLQDDPKYIKVLYDKIQEGYDIVYTMKKERKHSWVKNITASFFNSVFNYLIDNTTHKYHRNVGAYSIISRKVANAFISYNDYHRHYLMVLYWLGFNSTYLPIEHKNRFEGESSYSVSKLIKHALDGIVSQSDRLLRISVSIGLFFSIISFFLIACIVTLYFTHGFLNGWASIIVALLFSTGLILTGIGVLGIYLGKTFDQAKNRPKYIIDIKID